MVSRPEDEDDAGHRNFIRWSVPLDGTIQEESVEVISEESTAATIRALSGLLEKTPVYIKANAYTGNGIVKSCIPEGLGHRVVIQLVCNQMITIHSPNADPGVFAIDGFLTEEEESRILDALTDGGDLPDEPEAESTDSAFGLLRGLQSVLSLRKNSAAAAVGANGSDLTVIQ